MEPTSLIKDIFVNLLIVLSPIYFYQWIFSNPNKKFYKVLAGICFGAASILSMEFPIIHASYGGTFIWDLRYFPFVICILYMGPISGTICGILLVSYRFFLGGSAASLNVFISSIILFAAFILFRPIFHKLSIVKKYLVSFISSILIFALVIISINIHFHLVGLSSSIINSELLFQTAISYILCFLIYTYFTESKLNRLNLVEEIHKAEKLNIVSELAASIAHEIRNPLTVVRGFIQLTKSKVDPTTQNYMNTAINELDRAETIISDYLNFAKPQLTERFESFNASIGIKETILLMNSYANIKGIELNSQIDKEVYIEGDPLKFKQALLNIIKNAIEATDKGNVSVLASFNHKKGQVIIEVIDTGSGMSKEHLQKIGKAFYTTKTEGTGLGLMVTFRLIEAIGGSLTFESEVGKGTKATITVKGAQKDLTLAVNNNQVKEYF
ncbi:sensor histidine kinase [Bacillus sp. S/N-304-OC-R1]|uniref:ATP-binding protein n=1 Tax=Bacillus sp. S/N-304-OC-R1 TaxID=2758034 RepID=UPI001C8E62B8|nr:sensor histidine kinase [Bacillus sp. S/N-304-OC-R1]MBY0121763.1 ATP-binding protein [Bacillus sp. S/N-304-OC-R1]